MKFAGIRWLFVVGAVGVAFAGVVSSNVGCGSDDAKTGTAGTSGTAGSSGGGSTGTGGSGTTTPKLTYNFDTATASDSTSWKLNDYRDGTPPTPAKNLGAYMNGDAGLTLTDPPTIEWSSDDSESSASSGSMKISVTFDSYGQYVDPVINLPGVVDLSNRTLTMKVRLVSGTFMAWSQGGVQFHFSTTSNYTYSAGTWVSSQELMGGGWKIMNIDSAIAVPANAGDPWDPTMVIQVGVQITAGNAGDAGAPSPGRLVFEIDTFKG